MHFLTTMEIAKFKVVKIRNKHIEDQSYIQNIKNLKNPLKFKNFGKFLHHFF